MGWDAQYTFGNGLSLSNKYCSAESTPLHCSSTITCVLNFSQLFVLAQIINIKLLFFLNLFFLFQKNKHKTGYVLYSGEEIEYIQKPRARVRQPLTFPSRFLSLLCFSLSPKPRNVSSFHRSAAACSLFPARPTSPCTRSCQKPARAQRRVVVRGPPAWRRRDAESCRASTGDWRSAGARTRGGQVGAVARAEARSI